MGTIAKTLMGIVRWILLILDNIVYSLIDIFYNIFEIVANVRLFNGPGENLITSISNRIYALIGVYALFMITFRLINMIINPDDVSSKDKGAGKLATRVIVMLCLTIIVPYIFNLAYDLQSIVLGTKSGNSDAPTGNLIFSLVLSDNISSTEKDATGKNISNQIFSSFVTMDDDARNASSCSNSVIHFNKNGNLLEDEGPENLIGESNETYKKDGKEEWCINYQIVISLLAGGFAAWAFAVYCLDIALRTAKLAFYQLIAPIPIATYIDGKKDGAFNNWVKQSISAYVDIFIRLMVISFLILAISNIPTIMGDLSKASSSTSGFSGVVETGLARAVIILGILMFAMQAPKLIKDLFGIKGDDGSMSMNLGKKLAAAPVAKAVLTGGAVGAGALAANTGKAIFDAKKNFTAGKGTDTGFKGNFKGALNAGKKIAFSGAAGATSGVLRGSMHAMKDPKSSMGKLIGDQLQATTNKRDLRGYRTDAGYTLGKRLADTGLNFIGQDTIAKTEVKSRESHIDALKRTISNHENMASNLSEKLSFDEVQKMDNFVLPSNQKFADTIFVENGINYRQILDENNNVIDKVKEEQYQYKLHRDEAEKISQEVVIETKKKKTYDEAYNRMERKKQS